MRFERLRYAMGTLHSVAREASLLSFIYSSPLVQFFTQPLTSYVSREGSRVVGENFSDFVPHSVVDSFAETAGHTAYSQPGGIFSSWVPFLPGAHWAAAQAAPLAREHVAPKVCGDWSSASEDDSMLWKGFKTVFENPINFACREHLGAMSYNVTGAAIGIVELGIYGFAASLAGKLLWQAGAQLCNSIYNAANYTINWAYGANAVDKQTKANGDVDSTGLPESKLEVEVDDDAQPMHFMYNKDPNNIPQAQGGCKSTSALPARRRARYLPRLQA